MPREIKPPNNLEIEQALKEFEMKAEVNQSPAEQVPKRGDSNIPKMVQLVMKWSGGTIKEQKTVEYVLLGFVVLATIFSLFLFFRGNREELPPARVMSDFLP